MPEARATQYINDERTRVTQWSFALPGDATGAHVHAFDYVVVPVTGGDLTVVTDDGTETRMLQVAGIPYSGLAGTSHNVISASNSTVVFVEVELTTQTETS